MFCESPNTHYCFLSKSEVDIFIAETGIDKDRVHFTKFCTQLPQDNLEQLLEISKIEKNKKYIFSGGNSLRDYDILLKAVSGLNIKTLIASSNKHVYDPTYVDFKYLNEKAYFEAMAASEVVVVPLIATDKRSVGQQTYLNSMALGKLTIISDVSGVRDHLDPNIHALLVPPGDANALRKTIAWALDVKNKDEVNLIAKSGQQLTEMMTFAHYSSNLGSLLETIAAGIPHNKNH